MQAPKERNPTHKSHQQWRISYRCQTAADIGYKENEKITVWDFLLRQELARISGRIMTILEPVVPIQPDSSVPTSSSIKLALGEPVKLPLMDIFPATQNRPNSRMIKGT